MVSPGLQESTLAAFNAALPETAERELLTCCASGSFARAIVFLICASGLSGQDMLDQLRARLGNDTDTERSVVRQELLKITRLRLTKLLSL